MKFFLRLKHWQLFLFSWGIPLSLSVSEWFLPINSNEYFTVMMVFCCFGTFGWIWAISTEFHGQLPVSINSNLWIFKVVFFIPMIYIACIMRSDLSGINDMHTRYKVAAIIVLLFFHLLSMACIFWCLRFAAKTYKAVELGRQVKFSDYAGEFFLIWFMPLGVWMLQPRLNKMIEKQKENILK